MKKTLIYSTALLAALAAVSCTQENWKGPSLAEDAAHAIDLGVQSAASTVVRATLDGDNDYNENTVYHIDYFIYKVNPSDNLSTESILHDRITYAEAGIQPVDETTAKANARRIVLDNIASLLTDNKGWVYIIANLPDEVTVPEQASLSTLRALTLDASFVTYTDSDLVEGYVNKDNRFVMASDVVAFTLTEKVATSVIAPLKRIASKVQLNLNIVESLEQDLGPQNTKHWTSQYDKTQVYLLWANKHSSVGGTPISYEGGSSNPDWFFNTPRYAMFSDGTTPGQAGGTVNPSLIGPRSTKMIGNYKKVQKEVGGQLVWLDNAEQETFENTSVPCMIWTNVQEEKHYYPVQSVPLYTYPLQWNGADPNAPFIKIILPWKEENAQEPQDFFYKLAFPKFKYSETDLAYELRSNYCFFIDLDISVLGSGADDVPIDVFGNYYIVGWDEQPVPMGGALDAGRYLHVPESTYEMYGDELEIPVRSSHDLEIIDVTNKYPNYQNTTPTTGHLTQSASESSVTGNNFYIAAQGRNAIILKHTPETNLNNMQPRDVAPITYTFRVRQQGAGGFTSQTVTVTQYPPLMIEAQRNSDDGPIISGWEIGQGHTAEDGYVFLNGVRSNTNQRANRGNTNFNMYVIKTSVLPTAGSMQNHILGDSRSAAINNNLGSSDNSWSYQGTPIDGGAQRRLTYYYPANEDQNYDNVIAPKFRIASSFGASSIMTRNNALQRCASYQEDGYPAGRWRLPTVAEIVYMANLTNIRVIPRLLGDSGAGTTYYWSNSGYVSVPNAQNTSGTIQATHATDGSRNVRCVYDEWYWEGDTVDRTTFRWGDRQR